MFRKLLALAILLAPATARADWYEASSAHFVVYSDRSPERLREFATRLERFDKGLRALLGIEDRPVSKASRLTVYVVDNTADVQRLAGIRYAAGFYVSRASGSLAIVPETSGEGRVLDLNPIQILLHEYAHHFMWSAAPNSVYPSWFIEGFAEFNATAKFGSDGSITFGEPPLYRGVGLMRGNALPIQKLLTADTRKLDQEEIEGLYGRGWLLTHYLRIGAPQRNDQLRTYIAALNGGKTPLEAAAAFGDLRQLDRELERYKRGRFKIVTLGPSRIAIGPIELRKLTEAEAATMKVRIRSKVGVSPKTAGDVYADARRAAAQWPNNPAAQIVLAEAAYDAGDFVAAEAAADRAIAADAEAIDAHIYKAKARIARAKAAEDKSPATWSGIRGIIVTANRLDPDDPEPLILYYRSFVGAGTKPSEMAMQGLNRAFELAPQDASLRFDTAAMFLRIGNKTMARALLAPLAFQPHGRGLTRRAAALVERIDAGDIEGAIAGLDAPASTDQESDAGDE